MTGVLGLLDPSGADARELRAAASAASYRGSVEIRSFGPILLGRYARPPHESRFVQRPTCDLVVDSRVDATLPGSVAQRLSDRFAGDELLAAVLDEAGPGALEGFAADFAFARWDREASELLLSRDAFGLRPLYWARRDGRLGFAPDPSVLVAIGLVSGELEFDVVSQAVQGGDPIGESTAFAGVSRVRGGHWISFDLAGRVRRGRWFRPELVDEEPMSMEDAVPMVREAVVGAVASRTQGERVAILLSGGRDSGAVAAAAKHAGVTAQCFTERTQPDTVPTEIGAARELATAFGHPWSAVPIDTHVTADDLMALPSLAGSPIGFPSFPVAKALRDAASAARATVVLNGEGGDVLFAPSLVAVLDLARSGQLRSAVRAATAFRRSWAYSYPVIAKAIARSLAPRSLLSLRERLRPRPPWAVTLSSETLENPGGARDEIVALLASLGGSHYLELQEQLLQRGGLTCASPLYDQRVVRAALALPIRLQIPIPQAKPVLSRALLGEFSRTRIKASHGPYFSALAQRLHADFPYLFESGSLSGGRGFVRGPVGPLGQDSRWLVRSLNVVPTEMWLRAMEDRDGAGTSSGV